MHAAAAAHATTPCGLHRRVLQDRRAHDGVAPGAGRGCVPPWAAPAARSPPAAPPPVQRRLPLEHGAQVQATQVAGEVVVVVCAEHTKREQSCRVIKPFYPGGSGQANEGEGLKPTTGTALNT